MSRKKSCVSSHTRIVPFGDTLGRPSGVTVAAKHRWADWITARMSAVSTVPPDAMSGASNMTPRIVVQHPRTRRASVPLHARPGRVGVIPIHRLELLEGLLAQV